MRGCRVTVQFGKTKTYTALVTRVHDSQPSKDFKVKELQVLLDEKPVVSAEQFNLWNWIAQYYMCSFGEVFKAAISSLNNSPRKRTHAVCPLVKELDSPKKLNNHQQQALKEIKDSWLTHDVTLLHGVTSSGKTEIYIHLIDEILKQGKQVLYMLPEIALTTQITNRLQAVFGDQLGVYHSKFTDRQRSDIYQRQMSDNPFGIILGVRSSIFLPYKNLGMIIVDEEHEQSYKQQNPAPRYHARSCAIMLAKQFGAKTLLGSATPSIETVYLSKIGKYGYVSLNHRHKDIQLPDIEVVDIGRLSRQKRMRGVFSSRLLEAITDTLEKKEQIILFKNRRGFSNFIQCKKCGWVPTCQSCDVSLTYHRKSQELTCHYCGKTYKVPESCPHCNEKTFIHRGSGTENIEEQIHTLFPTARVVRMDLDTAKTRNDYEDIVEKFSTQQCDILIGTQMVTKGFDFDRVSLVGILDADVTLNIPDFRSEEHAFQMLQQVAGRAGRNHHKGLVILQTRQADSEVIHDILANDYQRMYESQITQRKNFKYPPYYRLITVYLKHRDKTVVEECSNVIGNILRKYFPDRVLGPDRPLVSRVKSLIIRKLIIKVKTTESPKKIREILEKIQKEIIAQPTANGLTVFYDVDPV